MPLSALFLLALLVAPARALAAFSVTIGAIDAPELQIKNLAFQLPEAGQTDVRQLALSMSQLVLPRHKKVINNIDFRCHQFKRSDRRWRCGDGRAKLSMGKLAPLAIQFNGQFNPDHWDLALNAAAIPAAYLTLLPLPEALEVSQGSLDLDLALSGFGETIAAARLQTRTKRLSMQTGDGRYASENLNLHAQWRARYRDRHWHWRNRVIIHSGAVYADPLYWESGPVGLEFYSLGSWRPKQKNMAIKRLKITQGKLASVVGGAAVDYQQQPWAVRSAHLAFRSHDLTGLSNRYLKPFTEQSQWAGVTFDGQMTGHLTITGNRLSALTLGLADFAIHDEKARFGLRGGGGIINWSSTLPTSQPSYWQWEALNLGPVAIGATQLNFGSQANSVWLLNPASALLLGGKFTLAKLAWQKDEGQEARLQIAGELSDASLQQLSQSLGGPPLTGLISGEIPGIRYQDGLLKLAGGLRIRAFDGTINVGNLAVSGLLSDFPQLYGDMTLDKLDLGLLTDRFQFGGITGKLSGFVNNLHLEKWRPVQFFAWLGTPDDDPSSRRISQKAVKNIASIGGASPYDIVTRGLLNFFEEFRYDKIGLGCYLNDGVCQLMGIGPMDGGYSIIKGGGLPRIDVIGHNPRVDWDVLLERLRRVTATDAAIIK